MISNLYKNTIEVVTLKKEIELELTDDELNLSVNKEIKEINCCDVRLSSKAILTMIKITGDRFIMGTPDIEIGRNDDETPQHEVIIKDFFVSQYLVTQNQYQEVMNKNPSVFQGENKPVENLSWYEAQEFCHKASQITGKKIRLLTEAEWEYVCRAGTDTSFHYGTTITSELANYKACYGYAQGKSGQWREETTEVGLFPPNQFGLYDLHGNVWEWCEDHWHENYHQAPKAGEAWSTQTQKQTDDRQPRVIRGGSWDDTAYYCRCGVRLWALPTFKGKLIGFRVAYDL
jgi:formylglycine-generating enzyme required for sulfatase activity